MTMIFICTTQDNTRQHPPAGSRLRWQVDASELKSEKFNFQKKHDTLMCGAHDEIPALHHVLWPSPLRATTSMEAQIKPGVLTS